MFAIGRLIGRMGQIRYVHRQRFIALVTGQPTVGRIDWMIHPDRSNWYIAA